MLTIVKDKLIEELDSGEFDVVIVNFANCDMVGHTGVIPAAIKAVEVVDDCVGEVYEKVAELGGTMLITADHGNAERLLDEEGNPFTAHTTNDVPLIVTNSHLELKKAETWRLSSNYVTASRTCYPRRNGWYKPY